VRGNAVLTTMPLDVCIVSPGLPHHGGTLAEKSLGASESGAIRVARALAARGHFVTVFSPGHQGGAWDNVTYLPIEACAAYIQSTPHDVLVISRALELVPMVTQSKVRILWCHDLGLKRQRGAFGQGLWNLDAAYVLSTYQRDQYIAVHAGVPPELFVVTRNGVDLPEIAPLRALPRDPKKLVYGSRPERGLENALAVMAELRNRGSDLVLHVAGYDNPVPHLAAYVEHLTRTAQALAPNVVLRGPLTQGDWQREVATARAVLYPGPPSHSGFGGFREISCVVAQEAMACGTPMVTCARGAVPETIGSGGAIFVGDETTDCLSPAHIRQCADAVQMLADNDEAWQGMHAAALARGEQLGWDGVAAQWEADWINRLTQRASDPRRLDAHLKRTGDLEALTPC
jgi:glycosyltransferase involved in cell wall biosynthesis